MKFKTIYDEKLPGCYVVGSMGNSNNKSVVFASEKEGGPIVRIDLETLEQEVLCEKPGGCMNVIELKGESESFLAIQKFFPIFRSEEAVVIWGRKIEGKYQYKEILKLPFAHRIDVVSYGGNDYLMAASLCATKDSIDDWTHPGGVYAGKIDYEKQEIVDVQEICGNILKNHGFTKIGEKGEGGVLISGDCGVFLLKPPQKEGGKWSKEAYISTPASDAVVVKTDDSELEIGVIEPFHGNLFRIYKGKEKREVIYELEGQHDFGHAIWGGIFNGKKSFIVGFRGEGKELYLITIKEDKYTAELIEAGAGTSNVTVIQVNDKDYICAANLESNRCTIYRQAESM